VRVEAGVRERLFPIWLLVNAIVSTLVAAAWTVVVIATSTASRDRVATAPPWSIEAVILAITVFAWLAWAGRRRRWNEGATTLLGLPSMFLNVIAVFVVTVAYLLGAAV